MTHSPPLPAPTATAVEVARYLRVLAGHAARRPTTLVRTDLDMLIAAAGLIELSFAPVPVTAGGGA